MSDASVKYFLHELNGFMMREVEPLISDMASENWEHLFKFVIDCWLDVWSESLASEWESEVTHEG